MSVVGDRCCANLVVLVGICSPLMMGDRMQVGNGSYQPTSSLCLQLEEREE